MQVRKCRTFLKNEESGDIIPISGRSMTIIGIMSPELGYCSVLAKDALKAAVEDYRKKQQEKGAGI